MYGSLAQKEDSNHYNLSVLIEGVKCAGCIRKVESAFANDENVDHARVNLSAKKLSLAWTGDADYADTLINKVEGLGFEVYPYSVTAADDQINAEENLLIKSLAVGGFAAGNVMLISVALWITTAETMGVATRNLLHWLTALIAIPAIFYAGRVFFKSAIKAIKSRTTNMDIPISVALILTTGMSLFETYRHGEHVYFDSAVMLMFFLLLGRYLDFTARKKTRKSASDLLQGLKDKATRILDSGEHVHIFAQDLEPEMIVLIKPGEKFPTDGILLEDVEEVDTSLITGESLPHPFKKDETVYAGMLNMSAPVKMKVSKTLATSLVSDIQRLIEKSSQSNAKYVRLCDRIAGYYTPVVHLMAVAAFFGWWVFGNIEWQSALMIGVTVLIITCPCALGLAVPVTQVLAIGKLMKNGIIVKSGDALEKLSKITDAYFDKTGVLTRGTPSLVSKHDQTVLSLAADLAQHSAHPLSRALVSAAGDTNKTPIFEDISEVPGQGVTGKKDGMTFKLGRAEFCGLDEKSDQTVVWFTGDNIKEKFVFNDEIRTDSKDVIEFFKNKNIPCHILTGDQKAPAQKVANELGIKDVHTNMTPDEKYQVLEQAQKSQACVLMVGDGLNDAASLSAADISIAPGSAVDITQNAADIVFTGKLLSPVTIAHRTAVKTQSLVRQNIAFALGYNIIAIPVAMSGIVTPLIAALAMSLSSLVVTVNSFRVRRNL